MCHLNLVFVDRRIAYNYSILRSPSVIVNVQDFHWCLGLLLAIVKCTNAFFYLAEFGFSRVLLDVASKLWSATKLLIDFENQLLSVNFSITEVFVDLKQSLAIVGFCCGVLKE